MGNTTTVTFTARDSAFIVMPGQTVIFDPVGAGIAGSGGTLIVRNRKSVVADGAGAGSVDLVPGDYNVQTIRDGATATVACTVPDTGTATISECIAAVGQVTYNGLAVSMLAAGLRFYGATTDANSDTTLPSWSYYISFAAGDGILRVYRKVPVGGDIHTSAAITPVFPQVLSNDGSAAAPGWAFASDLDTGLFSAGANQLGAATGGIQRLLLTTTALQVSLPITGTAVTQSTTDTTAGRLLKVGDFGLGNNASALAVTNLDDATLATGFYRTTASTTGTFPVSAVAGALIVESATATQCRQTFMSSAATDRAVFTRRYTGGAWTAWDRQFSSFNLLGTVSQSGGVPTGAVMERGTGGNGSYERRASGWQTCTRTSLTVTNVNTAQGSVFRSASVTWTFPADFDASVTPMVQAAGDNADCIGFSIVSISNTAVTFRLVSAVAITGAVNIRAQATGRWAVF